MDLLFEKGSPDRPKGHALVYFRVDTEPGTVYASYIIVLPVLTDFSKYIPPFLAAHVGNLPIADFSAFAMPPVPEAVDSYAELERLGRLREDDLVFAGSIFSYDLPRMMESVSEAVQSYSRMCSDFFGSAVSQQVESPQSLPGVDDDGPSVTEVLFSLMSEGDKLAELSRLLGRLRFAQEGRDTPAMDEVCEEITALTRYLPEDFQLSLLLAAAQDASQKGAKLAQLYLDRCFRMSAGDSGSVRELDEQIEALNAQE